MCSFRSSSRSVMNVIPARRRVHTNGHRQHLTAMERMPAYGLEARATVSACSPANAACHVGNA